MGSYDAYLWHVTDREKMSEWEALFVHAIIEWAKLRTGKEYVRVLDAPCGNGRLHPFLRRFGYEVKGFDISEEMVEEAKKKGCDCWVGDLRDPEAYRGKYDVVLNWFTSFGYFEHEENVKVMENFYEVLEDGGILILDLPIFGKGFAAEEFVGIARRGEDLIEIMENKVDGNVNRIRNRLFRDKGSELVLVREIRISLVRYSVEELEKMMKGAGFREVHAFETMKTVPPSENSRRVTLVGIK